MGVSKPVLSLHDVPMWDSIARQRMELQCCQGCQRFRYPPAPICAHCLSMAYRWQPISGRAKILSWVVFHRQYFDDHPPPYNAVAVELEEGPIVISNLVGDTPSGSWVGKAVEFCYQQHGGRWIHKVRLR